VPVCGVVAVGEAAAEEVAAAASVMSPSASGTSVPAGGVDGAA